MRKTVLQFSLLFIVVLLAGCAASYLTSVQNNMGKKLQYDKIMVVAKTKSQAIRIDFEGKIVAQLAVDGVNAVSSQGLVPNSMFEKKPDEASLEELRVSLLDKGIDGVLITSLVDQEEYVDVIPGSVSPYPYYRGGYNRYWRHYPMTYWEPDRIVSGTTYYLESGLYDISLPGPDNLHWVAGFRLKSPGNIEKWSGKYATDLVKALIDEKTGAILVTGS